MTCSRGRDDDAAHHLISRLLLIAALAVASGHASADAFTDARKVFERAQQLYDEGKFAEAAEGYTASYRMIRSPLIFFNIAQARRRQYQQDGNYANLVAARSYYQRFLDEADPSPQEQTRARANLNEVISLSREEARRRTADARKAYDLGKFADAVAGYEAAYELSGLAPLLYNLAQAQRKQFNIDGRLERLARAEDLIKAYQRESEAGAVDPAVVAEILEDIKKQRAAYHRRREAEARSKEPPAMREAREAYQRGDAAAALSALVRAEKTPDNPRLVLLQLYRLRGQASVLARRNQEAVEAFKRYLALEPGADGTGLAADARPAFEAAQLYWKGKEPLRLEHLAPGKVAPKKPVAIPVKVASDPLKMVERRRLLYRRPGMKKWGVIQLSRAEEQARLPPNPFPARGKRAYRMEYYVQALDQNSAILDSLGNQQAPLAFLVTRDAIPRPTPLYKKWWVWAAAGGVVATTVATIFIVTNDGLPDNPVAADISR